MVAVRKKVGARGCIRMKPLAKGKKIIKIDCSIPVRDGIFDDQMLNSFEQYFHQQTKLHGLKGKLSDKVKITMNHDKQLVVSTTMKYHKRYFKYLTKKFLKKHELRDWLRILAVNKQGYQLRYYNIRDQNEAAPAS